MIWKYVTLEVSVLKTLNRTTGSTATKRSYTTKPINPTIPKTSGTTVLQEFHGYCTPPQVIGMMKEVEEAMNRKDPIQSTLASFSANRVALKLSLRNSTIIMKPRPAKGRLIQNIHLQETKYTTLEEDDTYKEQ